MPGGGTFNSCSAGSHAKGHRTPGRRVARRVPEAILWIECTGERCMCLPAHKPPQQTCYARYLNWKRSGVVDRVPALLAHSRETLPAAPR
ncbi:transposase [Paraburkholderia fynbosensis]|uniref:transposase n=1 Tax=Paraburkholderia fynbosensis TaxID=1200993 RepID=UPI003CCD84E5